jgi:hypothetical protein
MYKFQNWMQIFIPMYIGTELYTWVQKFILDTNIHSWVHIFIPRYKSSYLNIHKYSYLGINLNT